MVGADPARRSAHTVEGPTLHDRETEFGRGIASSDRSPTCFGRSSRTSARSFGPGRRSTRLLAVLAIALLAAGCGGGDEGAAVDAAALGTDPAAMTGTDPAGAGTAPDGSLVGQPGATDPLAAGGEGAGEEVPGANEISNADASSGTLVKVTAITPKAFAAAHCSKPILVVMYQPGGILDERLLQSAKAGAKRAGTRDLVVLEYNPRDVKAMGDLPSKLGLLSSPGVATVGRDGTIANFWTTYVDEALIEKSLRNAAASRNCKVSSEDVPAAGSQLADAALVASGGTVTSTTADPMAGSQPGAPALDAATAGAVAGGVGAPVA